VYESWIRKTLVDKIRVIHIVSCGYPKAYPQARQIFLFESRMHGPGTCNLRFLKKNFNFFPKNDKLRLWISTGLSTGTFMLFIFFSGVF
jgi:hypothetical protein